MKIDLIHSFNSRIVNWQSKLQEDEWFFAELIEDLTSNLQSYEAFDLIPEAVDLILQQSDGFLCRECLELLLELSRIADTTEIHPSLDSKWEQVCNHVSQFGDYHKRRVGELKRWYRRYS